MGKIKSEIGIFFILLFILSGISYFLISETETSKAEDSIAAFLLVYSPFLAAIITRLICERNIKKLGWKFGKAKYLLLAFIIPITYGIIIYGFAWLTKIGSVNEQITIMGTDSPSGFALIVLFLIGIIARSIGAFGEEVGWRGFLTPRLYKLSNLTTTSIIIGLVWTIWHLPLMILANYGGDFLILKVLFSCISLISLSFMLTWLRIKSASLWVGVIYHASHNFLIQGFFDQLLTEKSSTVNLLGEMGAGVSICSIVIAIIFWRLRKKLLQPASYIIN
jgi:membrane protease YdiL (CAAX protease family)